MVRPLGPGAQRRLQQPLHPSQVIPSTPPQKVGPSGTAAQVPTLAPSAITHSAAQQSPPRAQMSPGWMHHDTDRLQRPSSQAFEQHSPSPLHSLPDVLHSGFRATHTPSSEQVPPQQSVESAHSAPSDTHAVPPQAPSSQTSVQQSVGAEQGAPCC